MAVKKNHLVFVVENNQVYNQLITSYLKKNNFSNVHSILSGEECVELVKNGKEPVIVIQDYSLDGMNGLDVLRSVKKISPKTEFIFLTGNENIEVAINTIKYGAFDYIVKDKLALEKVVYKMNKIMKMLKLENKNKQIRKLMYISLGFIFVVMIFALLVFVFHVINIREYI